MHSAPAVSFPVGRSFFQALVLFLAWLAGALACGLWLLEGVARDWRHGVSAVLVLFGAILSMRSWLKTEPGMLRWDGQIWWLEAGDSQQRVRVKVHLDVQRGMLLSLQTDAGLMLWFWPERKVSPNAWQAFRRAVYGQQGDAGGDPLASELAKGHKS